MKAKKLSQLQLVNNYIKQIEAHFEAIKGDQLDYRGLYELMGHLVKTLSKTVGKVDGVSGGQYLVGMRIARAVRELQTACEEWKRLV